jgi:hypothetical protein
MSLVKFQNNSKQKQYKILNQMKIVKIDNREAVIGII